MNVSTHQQSGNPTGSRIRRLAIHTEGELARNIAEVCLPSLALILDRFCTGFQIRDLIILQYGKVAAGEN